MANYDTTVKFNSRAAEQNVNSLAKNIDGLRGKLKSAQSAATGFASGVRSSNGAITATSGRVNTLTNSVSKMSSQVRSARTDVLALGRALDSAKFRNATESVRQLGTGLASAAKSVGLLRASTRILGDNIKSLGSKAGTAATQVQRLATALQTLVPATRSATGAALRLSQVLQGLTGTPRVLSASLREMTAAGKAAERGVSGIGSVARTTAPKVDQLTKSTQQAQKGLISMGASAVRARNVFVYLASGFGISKLAEYSDTFKEVEGRLKLVTSGSLELAAAENKLFDISEATRTGYRENAVLFTRLAQAGKAYGVSNATTIQITENVAKSLQISGASAGEASAAMLQLSQAFQSGRIQGDELRSVLENSPRITKILTDRLAGLGITLGNIRQKAKEGKIGIKELTMALGDAKTTEELKKEFENIPVTISGALKAAEGRFIQFIGQLDKATGASNLVVKAIQLVSANLDTVALAAGIAGAALLTSYVPALVQAIKYSRLFALFSFANYGKGVKMAMGEAVAGLGLFKGALKTSASSTLPAWKQVVGNVTTAATLNFRSLFGAVRSIFGRWPVVFAVATTAMWAFNNDTQVMAGKQATIHDYMVSGWGIASEKIAGIWNWLEGVISSGATRMLNQTASLANGLYQIAKYGAGAVVEGAKQASNALVPGGNRADWSQVGRTARNWSKGSALNDFGRLTAGTRLQRDAEQNAFDSRIGRLTAGAGLNALGLEPFPSTMPNFPDSPSGDDKASKKAAREAEKLQNKKNAAFEAYNNLIKGFTDANKASEVFRDGINTLNEAQKLGVITSKQYSDALNGLAKNAFPGVSEALKDLVTSNKSLQYQADGVNEQTIKFREQRDIVLEQIGVINDRIAKEGDVNGVLAARKNDMVTELGLYREQLNVEGKLKKKVDERAESLRQITQLIDDASSSLYDALTKSVRDALDFNKNIFKNFFKSLVSMAKDIFASVIAAEVFGPLREGFRNMLNDAFRGTKNAPAGSQAASVKPREMDPVSLAIDIVGNGTTSSVPLGKGGTTINLPNITGGATDKADTAAKAAAAGTGAASDASDIVVNGIKRPGLFQSITEGFKGSWKESFKGLGDLFKPIGKIFKGVGEKLGINTQQLGKAIGGAGAGAMKGLAIAGLGKALGLGGSSTGGAIGGAIGGATGIPGLDIVGSVVGSLVGGLFKKVKKASVNLSTDTYGGVAVGEAVGNSNSYKANATALGGSFGSSLSDLANQLGGTLASGVNLGSIGMRKKKFTFDPSGSGRTKGSGVQTFASEEDAIAAAVSNALMKGVVQGLSETSDKVLRTVKDTNKALGLVTAIEEVKKAAAQIRDPIKYQFDEIKKNLDVTLSKFREAGASASDYADLQLVTTTAINDVIKDTASELKAFRDSLYGGDLSYKSTSEKLKIANDKFGSFERDIASGKSVDQSAFTSAGTDLSNLARELYGSTPEFQQYQNRLLAATDKLIGNVNADAERYKPIVDALNAQTAASIAAAQQTNQLLSSINTSLSGATGIEAAAAYAAKYRTAKF